MLSLALWVLQIAAPSPVSENVKLEQTDTGDSFHTFSVRVLVLAVTIQKDTGKCYRKLINTFWLIRIKHSAVVGWDCHVIFLCQFLISSPLTNKSEVNFDVLKHSIFISDSEILSVFTLTFQSYNLFFPPCFQLSNWWTCCQSRFL